MATSDLEEQVLAELLALRRQTTGVTVQTLARSPVISDLLGSGDPYVAYTRLSHEILEADTGLAVEAAAASLGFLAEGDTHLKRLDAFGDKVGMEQRQVRRYSDRGIRVLARLIAANWPTETAPRFDVDIVTLEDGWEIQIVTAKLPVVTMRPPTVTLLVGSTHQHVDLVWVTEDSDTWQYSHTSTLIPRPDGDEETSLVVVWRGELRPKYLVSWHGLPSDVASESFGNKLMLRLVLRSDA